jgi:hypothetical protein
MNSPGQTKNLRELDAADKPECRAELIFYAKTRAHEPRPVKTLGDYACDYRRPDWDHRWSEWCSRKNPYLNLFLCREHAVALGLLKDGEPGAPLPYPSED